MNNHDTHKIFRNSSTTYYYTSLFFPLQIREDVFHLYAYVRTVDNFVDNVTPDVASFHTWKKQTLQILQGQPSNIDSVQKLATVIKKYSIDHQWIHAFLKAMETDLTKRSYETFHELEEYMYGSAEVVGLMMSQIMRLPKEAFYAARKLGTGMQLINFVRDISEDLSFNRIYIPQEDLKQFNIDLYNNQIGSSVSFKELISFQAQRIHTIINEAKQGFSHIPRRYRIPIQTATDMYMWTLSELVKNPARIFQRKVKPHKTRVLLQLGYNAIAL